MNPTKTIACREGFEDHETMSFNRIIPSTCEYFSYNRVTGQCYAERIQRDYTDRAIDIDMDTCTRLQDSHWHEEPNTDFYKTTKNVGTN